MFSPRRFPQFSLRKSLALLFAAALLSCLPLRQEAFAQTPEQLTRQASRAVYPEPPLPALPAAGGKVTDQTFGTEIMRVTDASDGNLNGTFYPHWPSFNADSTRLLVKRYQTGDAIYDFNPETFTLGGRFTFPRLPDNSVGITESAIWSATDPDTLFILGWAGPKLWAFNARTRQYALVHDFSRDAGFAAGDYLWQMSMSADGNTFAFTRKNASYETVGYAVYRRSTDSVVLNAASREEDEVRIDKTGRYLVLYRSTLDASGNECVILDLATGGRDGLKPGAPDYAPGHGDLGTGTMVAWDNDNNKFLRRDLSNPHQTTTVLDMGRDWMNQHLSMLGGDESWALVGFFSYRGGGLEPGLFHDELLLVKTDGSGQVRRLLQHRSKARDYWAMPRATMSYDGRFVAFSSNWGGAERTDLFVARINSTPAAVPPPLATPTPAASPSPTPAQSPSSPFELRLNVGGGQHVDSQGRLWQADAYFAGGTAYAPAELSTADVLNTSDDALYRSERYGGAPGQQPLSYSIPVAAGEYLVRLHFAEIWHGVSNSQGAGSRLFGVTLEGSQVLDNYDVTARSGGALRALVEEARVTVTDGALDIRMAGSVDHAKVNAIEVISVNQPSPQPTPAPTPTPTPVPTPAPTPEATPAPTPGRAQSSLTRARRDAQDISNDLAEVADGVAAKASANAASDAANRIAAVVATIQETYGDFGSERSFYEAAARIETALKNALDYASRANVLAQEQAIAEAKENLRKAINYLELADVLMIHGNVGNPVDYAQYFVRQHYVDFLGREPDEAGRNFWAGKIAACGSDRACAEVMRIEVSAAYFQSIEFKETGYLAYRLYRASFGRTVLFEEFLDDTQEIGKGLMVGKPGWVEKLAANKRAFIEGWVQREDFRAVYDNMKSDWFVNVLFERMGVTPAPEVRDALIADLNRGVSRAEVLARMVEHEEFSRQELNKAFVLMQYFGYLRRDPDAGGFNHWLKKLNDNNGDYRRAQMVQAFLDSIEYRDRFVQP